MKNINYFRTLLGALVLGLTITACDKFEDDVPPARMAGLSLNDDFYTTSKNLRVQLNVLANDTIGSSATVQFTQPQHGNILPDSSGHMFYKPLPNFVGTDVFTYKACLDDNCATANVTITVQNDSTNTCIIKAYDDVLTVYQNSSDSINVMSNDNLCTTSYWTGIGLYLPALHGFASLLPDKSIIYRADSSFVGTEELSYTINNSYGTSTAKLRINVLPKQPTCHVIARPDSAYTKPIPGTTLDSVSIKVVANDFICAAGAPVTIVPITTGPIYGSLNITNNTGINTRIIYTTSPNAPSYFNTSFQYRLCQGNNCSVSTVYIMRR